MVTTQYLKQSLLWNPRAWSSMFVLRSKFLWSGHHKSSLLGRCWRGREIVLFWIRNCRWIQTLTIHSHRFNLDIKYNIQKFRQVSVWNLNINNTQSNKEVFSSLEFVKVLLQIEAKLVIMRPHFLRAQNPLLLPFQTPAMQRNRQQLNSYNQRQNQLRHFALKGLFDFSMFQLQMEMSKSQMWLYWLQFWIL